MTIITVTIDEEGSPAVLAQDTLEDFLHDFQYFLAQAKANLADNPQTMFLHKRYLRAALFTLFAYVEGVTNRWLFVALDTQKLGFMFKRLERDPLDEKIGLLCELRLGEKADLNLESARQVRNLLVHFKPGQDAKAFEKLSLALIEEAAVEIDRWMTGVEARFGLPRHNDTNRIVRDFMADLGVLTQEASSDPNR